MRVHTKSLINEGLNLLIELFWEKIEETDFIIEEL
jgi:hypothetical protein